MDRPTRTRLYHPTSAMVECLIGIKNHYRLSNNDAVRAVAIMVATMDDDARGAFQAALEDVRKDMTAENVFERADLSLAIEQSATVERKQ